MNRRAFRVVFVPTAVPTFLSVLAFALGVVIFAILGAAVLGGVGVLIFIPLPDKVGDALRIAFFCFGVFIGPLVWVRAFASVRHMRKVRRSKHRTDRLKRVFQNPQALERLPHRWIERLHRESMRGTHRAVKFLPSVRRGECIVILARNGEAAPYPTCRDTQFEPIDIQEAAERSFQLCEQLYIHREVPIEENEVTPEALRKVRRMSLIASLFGFLGLIWMLWSFLVSPLLRRTMPNPILMIALGVMGAWMIYLALFFENRWWVASGALLYRSMRRFGGITERKRFIAETTPLLLDFRTNHGYLLDDGNVRSFLCSTVGIWLVLAGWVSSVPPPSESEAQQFMGLEN